MRNCGSTESLKPRDDGEAHPVSASEDPTPDGVVTVNGAPQRTSAPPNHKSAVDVRVSTGTADPAQAPGKESASYTEANSPTSSAVERQTPQVAATASANARANLQKTPGRNNKRDRQTNESVLTGNGGAVATKYRSRSLVIVYYDSYVQSFFEEVVKFVSASRNLMRKAKMAAKVAQIKRMAEMVPEDEDDDDDCMDGIGSQGFGYGSARLEPPQLSPSASKPDVDGEKADGETKTATNPQTPNTGPKPQNGDSNASPIATVGSTRLSYNRSNGRNHTASSPRLITTFRPSMAMSPSYRSGSNQIGPLNGADQPTDIFETLDKTLEQVQSLCEIAAHQFLRDGDCADEIARIKASLSETQTSADTELRRRLADEDADGSLARLLAEGPPPTNTYRTQTARMRMNIVGGVSHSVDGYGFNGKSTSPATGEGFDSGPMTLEVDMSAITANNIPSTNANGELPMPPKLHFRSTRKMGPPPHVSTGL